jgi:microcin C transport system ATP-binding protein
MGQKLPLAGLRVVDLLRDLQARHDLAYLFISHDLKVVRAMADELIVMREIPSTPTPALLAAAVDLEVLAA